MIVRNEKTKNIATEKMTQREKTLRDKDVGRRKEKERQLEREEKIVKDADS